MTEFVADLIEPPGDTLPENGDRRKAAKASSALDEFRAELACGCPQPGWEREPYEEGFAAYEAGVGLLENPYNGDNCAHQQWANGWSQARDEAQRRARQFPR